MNTITVNPAKKIGGTIEVPGDKSVSHRSLMIGSIAEGVTEVKNLLMAEDCICTMNAFKAMGIKIASGSHPSTPSIVIEGEGLKGLKKPNKELYLGNSGTTIRLLMGILAGQDFDCVLTGDDSLSRRPMKRVAAPLGMMGAQIASLGGDSKPNDIFPPLKIKGTYPLKSIRYRLPMASAQVKSAVLLAGLYADGITEIEEPMASRDHTERMLKKYGADIKVEGLKVAVKSSALKPQGEILVPGDISSAAFIMVAALILGSSKVIFKNLGMNPTRTGIIDVLKKMGANIGTANLGEEAFEPIADLTVSSSNLNGVNIEGDILPRLIDELPVIMVAAAFAKGTTVIKGAGELRVKETDRIMSMTTNLLKMGADIRAEGDDIIIKGTDELRGAQVESFGDHRTAMSIAIAALRAKGKTTISNTDCIKTSFPEFEVLLAKLVS